VDCLIDRDQLNRVGEQSFRSLKLILNGWFTHQPLNWPPIPMICPLILSFHLSDQMTRGSSAAEALVTGKNAAYLRRYGPIGARDQWTLNLLRSANIDAYFSGCLTLTLKRCSAVERQDFVVINDLSHETAAFIRDRSSSPILRTTHLDTKTLGSQARLAKAERLLQIYAQARYVVTSRLHCALPCLALGTPVLLVPPQRSTKRFSGLLPLTHNCTLNELHAGSAKFDLHHLPENPSGFEPLRERLIETCTTFVANTDPSPG